MISLSEMKTMNHINLDYGIFITVLAPRQQNRWPEFGHLLHAVWHNRFSMAAKDWMGKPGPCKNTKGKIDAIKN
jgi:hypothetical protein